MAKLFARLPLDPSSSSTWGCGPLPLVEDLVVAEAGVLPGLTLGRRDDGAVGVNPLSNAGWAVCCAFDDRKAEFPGVSARVPSKEGMAGTRPVEMDSSSSVALSSFPEPSVAFFRLPRR